MMGGRMTAVAPTETDICMHVAQRCPACLDRAVVAASCIEVSAVRAGVRSDG